MVTNPVMPLAKLLIVLLYSRLVMTLYQSSAT